MKILDRKNMKSKTHGQERFTWAWRMKRMRLIDLYFAWFVLGALFKDWGNYFRLERKRDEHKFTTLG